MELKMMIIIGVVLLIAVGAFFMLKKPKYPRCVKISGSAGTQKDCDAGTDYDSCELIDDGIDLNCEWQKEKPTKQMLRRMRRGRLGQFISTLG